jgi:hypothetical protein
MKKPDGVSFLNLSNFSLPRLLCLKQKSEISINYLHRRHEGNEKPDFSTGFGAVRAHPLEKEPAGAIRVEVGRDRQPRERYS